MCDRYQPNSSHQNGSRRHHTGMIYEPAPPGPSPKSRGPEQQVAILACLLRLMCTRQRPVSDMATHPSDQGDLAAPHWYGRAFSLPNPAKYPLSMVPECGAARPDLWIARRDSSKGRRRQGKITVSNSGQSCRVRGFALEEGLDYKTYKINRGCTAQEAASTSN